MRATHKLSATAVAKRTKPGRMGDGGGLYLHTKSGGARAWVFRYTRPSGGVTELGVGPFPAISLARAREIAAECRQHVAEGRDPKAERDRAKPVTVPTFREALDAFLAINEAEWRNPKHRQQWRNSLHQHAGPILQKPVDAIGLEEVLAVLRPIWGTKAETASRVRGRIERVLAFATVRGWRSPPNPATWRGNLDAVLPKPSKLTRGHHAAMPWADVPDLMARLRECDGMGALALRFIVLAAARTGEALGARWDEMDLERAVWTVPPDRMKAKREHRVPLSDEALGIVRQLHELRTDNPFVFPGARHGRPLSGMAPTMQLRRMGHENVTVHGMRSAFRDWAGDTTSAPREVAEAALAHNIGSAVERAYRRGDALEQRRALLDAWGAFCAGETGADVVRLYG